MEIKGNIDEWGCPVLECAVCNDVNKKKISVKATIDTGAFNFHLKKKFIELLDLKRLSNIDTKNPIHAIESKASYNGCLEINDIIFPNITILEMDESFDYDFIIGVQFLVGFSFNYEGQRRKWSITTHRP